MTSALLAAALLVAAAPEDLAGVWQGQVGNMPVQACFSTDGPSLFGAYYYRRHRRLIPLEVEDGNDAAFRERDNRDPAAPRWEIAQVDTGTLTGRWSQQGRTLPIRLDRIAWGGEGEDGPCMSMAFNSPRLEGVALRSESATADGHGFRRLKLEHGGRFEAEVESFALDRPGAAGRRVDAVLAEALSGDPPGWFECLRSALQAFPHEGNYFQSLQPAIISQRWLSVVQQHDSFCGGNHPNGGTSYRLFDLASGAEVDILSWFRDDAVQASDPADGTVYHLLRPELREAILAGWRHEEAECDEAIRGQDFWNAGITRGGFVFSPSLPHVIRACGEDFTLGFDRVRPFLNAEGSAALAAILSD